MYGPGNSTERNFCKFSSPRPVFSDKTCPSASVSIMLTMKMLPMIFKRDALLGSSPLKSITPLPRLSVGFG